MKALLYKDFLVLIKQMKLFLLMIAFFCLLPGELNMGAFFMVYAGFFLPVSLIGYDERAKWDSLAAMMPYSTRDLVLSRYVMGWICLVFAGVCRSIGLLISPKGRITGLGIFSETLLLVALTLILTSLFLPVVFRFGTEKARMYMIIGCAVIGIVVVGGGTLLADGLAPQLDPCLFLPVLLLLAVAVTMASIRCAMAQYERRQW